MSTLGMGRGECILRGSQLGSFNLSYVVLPKGQRYLKKLDLCLHFSFPSPPPFLAITAPSLALFHCTSSLQQYSKSTLSALSGTPPGLVTVWLAVQDYGRKSRTGRHWGRPGFESGSLLSGDDALCVHLL